MPPAARRLTLLLGLLIGLSATLTGLPVAALPAGGDATTSPASGPVRTQTDADDLARIVITDITPQAPRPGQDVLVTGIVVGLAAIAEATGDLGLGQPTVVLRPDAAPLTTRAELDLLDANPLYRYGASDFTVVAEAGPSLQPRQRLPFRLRVPMTDVGLGEPGVYSVGLDVLATDAAGVRRFVGSARTTIPVLRTGTPTPVALVWPVAAAPAVVEPGTLLDERVARLVRPDGRLVARVRAATGTPVSWLVDPDLVVTLQQMRDGYEVLRPPGESTGSADAAAFLETLAAATTGAVDRWRLPAADPDVQALAGVAIDEGRDEQLLADAVRDGQAVLPGTRVLGVPASGRATPRTVTTWYDAGVPTLLVDQDGVRTDTADVVVRLDQNPGTWLTVLRGDARLRAALDAPPRPGAADIAVAQRFLSEVALARVEAGPNGAAAPLIASPPTLWRADEAVARRLLRVWQTTRWIEPTGLRDLTATGVTAPTARPAPGPVPPERTLSAAQRAAVRTVEARVSVLQGLLAQPGRLSATLDDLTRRTAASAWLEQPGRSRAFAPAAQQALAVAEGSVQLVLPNQVTLTGARSGFPVTVINDLSEPVEVAVEFVSANADRLAVDDVAPIPLDAGEKRTLTVTAQATGQGRVPVTAQLLTTRGDTVGPVSTTLIDVRGGSTIGWALVAVTGAALVAAGLRFRLRRARGLDLDELAVPDEPSTTAERDSDHPRAGVP
jgi:hypothetical protein